MIDYIVGVFNSIEIKSEIFTKMNKLFNIISKVLKSQKSIMLILFLISLGAIFALCCSLKNVKVDRDAYKTSCTTMLEEIEQYKVSDSLYAAQVGELKLTVSEYKKYRAEDAALIKSLKADKPISIVHTETIIRDTISALLHDTLLITSYCDTITAKGFIYHDNWANIIGVVYKDSVSINLDNREELLVVTSQKRKKLWFINLPPKIFGYKSNTVDIVSKNPHTRISNIEWINLR